MIQLSTVAGGVDGWKDDEMREVYALGNKDERNWCLVEIARNCRTGLPGLYAAGDLTNTFGKRILIAAGKGAKAVPAAADHQRGREK